MTNEELVTRIQAGIDVPENMLQLWEQTKAFIHTVALRYQGYAGLDDLEQEGYLALYDAVDGFQEEKGCKFITYAGHWMRQRMRRYIGSCCQPVKIPPRERGRIREYRKMENAFLVYLGRKPTEWEAAYNMGLDGGQLKDLESALTLSQVGSLDSPISDEMDGNTLADLVPGEADIEHSVLGGMEEGQLLGALQEAVGALPGDMSAVIKHRYQEGKSIRETGKAMGLTISKVRALEGKALRELRWGEHLAPFLPEEIEAQAYRHNGVMEFNRTWESSTERAAFKLMKSDTNNDTNRNLRGIPGEKVKLGKPHKH